MSIIVIDDIIFNNISEERNYNYSSIFFFIILNMISLLCTCFYTFFYYKMPNYQNNPNSLTLYLIVIHGILNLLYLFIFLQIYFCSPKIVTIFMKISTILNPVIIFFSYFWISCLTHNIYVTYYNYKTNIDKRIKFYKLQSIIYIVIVYMLTYYNLDFNEINIMDKKFSFIGFYKGNFLILYLIINFGIILYIINRLYYIFKKNTTFFSLSTEIRRENTIRKLITSLIQRHIFCICYFLICFFPSNLYMIIKEVFDFQNFHIYIIDFITLTLLSIYSTFILLVKLTDPIMKSFIWKLIFCEKEIKKEDDSYKNLIELTVFGEQKNKINNNQDDIISPIIPFKERPTMNESCEFNLDTGKNDFNSFRLSKNSTNIINNKFCESDNFNSIKSLKNKLDKYDILKLNKENNISSNNLITKNKNFESKKIEMTIIKENQSFKNKTIKTKPIINKAKKLSFLPKQISKQDTINSDDDKSNKSNDDSKINYINSKNKSNIERTESFSRPSILSKTYQGIGIRPFDFMYYHLDLDDNLLRMMAISICIKYCEIYDNNFKYKYYFNSSLPWNKQFFYDEKSKWMEFDENNIPDWLSVKQDERFKKFNFRIKTFSPFVFHHLRIIDKITINNIIESLDPVKNLTSLNQLKVSGGRGDNSILSTWDKKFIIKTINQEEKNVLNKMLKAYHKRLRDTKSILCRIYGIFKIEVKDKGAIHVILQRNMDSLPQITKLLTFDLKGSTVDRQSINKNDEKLKTDLLFKKYSNIVLKDIDLKILKLKFNLNSYDSKNLIKSINNDSDFLEKYQITDYSLLVFVHKYRQGDVSISLGNSGVNKSQDKKFLFEFSIIDFLGTFNFEKRGEKLAKTFVSYIKQMKDTNFSVLDPVQYGLRFRNFAKDVIPINIEEDSD